MRIGAQVTAWRRYKKMTQAGLSQGAGLSRPYVSRLERGEVDPALSTLRRLAAVFGITVGTLLDERPPETPLGRTEIDAWARGALYPGEKKAQRIPEVRVLGEMIRGRRQALGLVSPRQAKHPSPSKGIHASRWIRASLGEAQWEALLMRIEKHASALS